MRPRGRKTRLSHNVIVAAKPKRSEYMLWDGTLSHFGLRVHPSGVRSFIVQTRARGRMRKVTLGRFPEMSLARARQEAASTLALLWAGGDIAPRGKSRAPLFRDFAARYRERRRYLWKPSSLKTHDIYMRNRLMPAFGRLRLDAIDHARVSAWFDAASASKPGAANRAFEILRAMLQAARQWGELGMDAPDACINIVMNRRKPVARYLGREELERLGAVLDRHGGEHPWPVAAIRLLTLTGARLSEVLNLRWDEIGELGEDGGGSARLEDSKTGPRTIWLGPEAAKVIAALPRPDGAVRVFPDELNSNRLYTFWVGIREEAGLPGLRIHDCRHTWASQGVMNGVGLTTVGRLLGHRKRSTTAIYAHLDDNALQDAAAQTARVVAGAMGYRADPLPEERDDAVDGGDLNWLSGGEARSASCETAPAGPQGPDEQEADVTARLRRLDWLSGDRSEPSDGAGSKDRSEPTPPRGLVKI